MTGEFEKEKESGELLYTVTRYGPREPVASALGWKLLTYSL